jgi:predicted metal-dependent hydrolase
MTVFFAPLRGRLRAAPAEPETLLVDIGERIASVRLKRDRRARRLTLRIPVASEPPVLTVPVRTRPDAVRAFLEAHRGWLADRLADRPVPTPFREGTVVPVRGVDHVVVLDGSLRGRTRLASADEDVPRLLVGGAPEHVGRRVRDFLRAEATSDLKLAVGRHAATLGARPTSIRIRDTVSRWGSCSADGSLSFSWRLVMAPPTVLDYLAAHEVAHLLEMNHSPAYWRIVDRLFPAHRAARAWLKREGARLHAFGAEPEDLPSPLLAR